MSSTQNTTNTEPTQAPFVTITRVPCIWDFCPLCEITPQFVSTLPETVLVIGIGLQELRFCDAHWAQVLHALAAATP